MPGPKPPLGLIAVALAVALVLGAPAVAAPPTSEGQAKEKLREGAARIMEAIELMIRAIPTYGMPRIDDDGNIIIPRRGGPLDQAPKDAPEQKIEDIPIESTKT
jgi:hypothetical protein